MKRIIALAILFVCFAVPAKADHVNGYTRRDGTYVQPYERSHPDGTVTNNYSYQGNTNPYTGSTGTNTYQHDLTSPNYTGPDANGHVGHANPHGGSMYGNGDGE